MAFPPVPVYPIKLDSDRTLFLVYNTTETKLSVDNQPWSEEIEIDPSTSDEIWADNGYGNISGELFYYDSVSKIDGKVVKLKGCARNIGGNQTRFNPAGSWVRSYVIAEHHNQLVDAIMNLEEFLLDISDRISLLENEGACADDCPTTTLTFDVSPADTCGQIEATYQVDISGNYTSVTINFGDGETATTLTGTHNYSPNAIIDPIVMIENDTCLTIQTPPDRTVPSPWDIPTNPPFSIPLCVIPELPPINIPSFEVPSLTLTFPQIILPSICISVPEISIPSIYMSISVNVCPISIISCFIPSVISIVSPVISFASISFPDISFASISFPNISFASISFPTISFASISFPTISFASISFPVISVDIDVSIYVPPIPDISVIVPSIPNISITWGTPPTISVNWGSCDCTITVACAAPSTGFQALQKSIPFAAHMDTFEDSPMLTIPATQALGIPSEIKLLVPEFKNITVQHDIPQVIEVIAPDLPKTISIQGPEVPLPKEIKIVGNVPESIRLDAQELPKSIKLDGSDLPTAITLQGMNLPSIITIDASDIPDKIQVTGIPSAIELKGQVPSEIFLKLPENIEVPLVYRGGPIPVQFDLGKLADPNGDDPPCFTITPCPKR